MPTANRKTKIMTMLGAMLALLLSALDQTIVSTAMPQIVREFNALSHLSWVFTAYLLASTITVPIYGKLSDIYGRRFFYIFGIIVFLIGSMLSGAAHSMLQLIIFRGIQGIGGGAIMVNSFAIIGDLFPPQERGKWQGLIGAVFGLSSVLGPLLGGWLTDSFSWRLIFYINIPLGLIALAVIALTLPKITHDKGKVRIDYAGSILLAATLITLLLALVWGGSVYAWNSLTILTLLAASLLLGLAFLRQELRAHDPVLPLHFFKNRAFSVSAMVVFLTAIGMFGAILYIPLFAQSVIHLSATSAGFILTPLMLGMVVSSTLTGQFISRTGKYKILTVCGVFLIGLGMFLFSQMNADTTHWGLVIRMIITGVGLGITMPTFNIVVQSAFPPQNLGVVTASMQLFRSVGGTVGTALLGGLLNAELAKQMSLTSALSTVYIIAATVIGVAFFIVLRLPEISLRRGAPRPLVEEAGIELEEELGLSTPEHEGRS